MKKTGKRKFRRKLVWLYGDQKGLRRPLDKHIDSQELDALVPTSSEIGDSIQARPSDAIRVASRHVRFCPDCSDKVSQYQQLVCQTSSSQYFAAALPGEKCRHVDQIDWLELAAGLWPSSKAEQLIAHAALCDQCGQRLRDAVFLCNDQPTPEEEKFLAKLNAPSRPESLSQRWWHWPVQRRFVRWTTPAVAIVIVALTVIGFHLTARPPITGPEFADFAVHAHQQYAIGNVGLEVRSDSQQTLNEWLQNRLPFQLELPANPPAPGEIRPFEIEGARLIQAAGRSSAFIAYQMDTGPASLIVTPETVAVASGGVEAKFKRVTFHYKTLEGYKVVTWTQHGRSYALVSEEGNNSQKSCMVCHFAMKDRDLTNTPTPLVKSLVQ
jgi:anti-sigma factor RsiW